MAYEVSQAWLREDKDDGAAGMADLVDRSK